MSAVVLEAEKFKVELEKAGGDFICATPLPAAVAKVRFMGRFQGQDVVWNMTLATLAHCREKAGDGAARSASAAYPCPFIEISAEVAGVYPLRVGLELASIDMAVIRKSIIMVRNYKRLAIGKMDFCADKT